jgi:hypothetical protein
MHIVKFQSIRESDSNFLSTACQAINQGMTRINHKRKAGLVFAERIDASENHAEICAISRRNVKKRTY